MADYINPPWDTDPDTLVDEAVAFIQATFPAWRPKDTRLDSVIINAVAQMASEVNDTAADVPRAIFRFFGSTIVGLPPIDDVPAIAITTWTAVDNAGYTIREGAQVGIPAAGDNLVGFKAVQDVIIPPGSTSTATGEVQLIATIDGADANELNAAPTPLDSEYGWVESITLEQPTFGGSDAESDDEYLGRLVTWMRLSAPRPILAADFATFLVVLKPEVAAAAAIDNLILPSTTGQERAVAVAVKDGDGAALGSTVKSECQALLLSYREQGFIVGIADPTVNPLEITYTAVARPGTDPVGVKDELDAAILAFASPATWGAGKNDSKWENTTAVRRFDMISAMMLNSQGVDYISDLRIGTKDATVSAADYAMTGNFPVPTVLLSDITGVVT